MKKDLMYLVFIAILLPVLVLAYFYFSESKKTEDKPKTSPKEELNLPLDLLCSPQITVVFQMDLANDEELSREIADMYISNRAYYYAGKSVPATELHSEKDVYIRFDSIDFSSLKTIDV